MQVYNTFNKLEQIDFNKQDDLVIFDVSSLNKKQKRRVMQYIEYRGCYSFNCNYEKFKINDKVYMCKICNTKFTDNDFKNHF